MWRFFHIGSLWSDDLYCVPLGQLSLPMGINEAFIGRHYTGEAFNERIEMVDVVQASVSPHTIVKTCKKMSSRKWRGLSLALCHRFLLCQYEAKDEGRGTIHSYLSAIIGSTFDARRAGR